MKKLTILTSVLALAACGGGSGGGGDYGEIIQPIRTNAETFYVSSDAADDAKINYVASKIPNVYGTETDRTAKLNIANTYLAKMHNIVQQYINLYGSSDLSTFIENNRDDVGEALKLFWSDCSGDCTDIITYISQSSLDNFEKTHGMIPGEMTPSDMLFNSGDVTLSFEDGKLVSIGFFDGNVIASNNFSETIDYTQHPYYDPDVWPNTGIISHKVVLYGSRIGLKYSDFGHIMHEETDRFADGSVEKYTDVDSLYGGYITKEQPKPTESTVFTGTAVAPVYVHTFDSDTGIDDFYTRVSVIDGATLTLDNEGKEILTANFNGAENPWYNLIITKTSPAYNGTSVEVSGDENIIPELYRIKNGSMQSNTMNTIYYGDNNIVSEAVVNADIYGEGVLSNSSSYTHEVDADIVFGGIK